MFWKVFLVAVVFLSLFSFVSAQGFPGFVDNFEQTIVESGNGNREDKELWSQQGICRLTLGCYKDEICYPFGFVENGTFCGQDKKYYMKHGVTKGIFITQLDSEESCSYNFECESNFCFNGKCVDDIKYLVGDLKLNVYEGENSISEFTDINSTVEKPIVSEDIKESESFFGFIRSLFKKNG